MTQLHGRPPRTVTEGLKRFELIAGAGSEESQQACAMTLLAWLAGREWTDRPPCAHPLIATAVIEANDASGTTPAMRADLVRAGKTGALDTWWLPSRVILWALSYGIDETRGNSYERTLRALSRITAWKRNKGLPSDANLTRADLTRANLTDANLARADLARAGFSGADLARANLADAILARANLADANLTDADLADADLTRANLTDANLTDANLTDADLAGADLARANLAGANLTDATGTPRSGMPDGWKLSDTGLWARA